MNLYIAHSGETLGPYSEPEINEHLASGALQRHDLGCLEGTEDWKPLSTLLPTPPRPLHNAALPRTTGQSKERVLFQDARVCVTDSRFMVGRQTYAMRNITSVQPATVSPALGRWVLMILFGVVVAVCSYEQYSITGQFIGAAFVLAGVIALGIVRPVYVVVLATSGGEVKAVLDRSEDYIETIIQALNSAIITLH